MLIICKKQIACVLFFSIVIISNSFGQIDTTLYDFNRLIIYGTGHYDIDSYYKSGWAATAQAIDCWGCGTTDRNLLLKNIELRFTGEYDTPYVLGNFTIHPIKDGTGSIATLVGARLYEIKDHPLNPNPGSNDYFNVRIPFEVWDAEANKQINITIYDRIQNVTDGGDFYAFNPSDRMYCYFLHKPYSETVADVDTATGLDCQYLTWNTVFWDTDWQKGDIIYIQYFNIFNGENTPPVAQFSINKHEIALGDSLLVDASESYDVEGNRLEYQWAISNPIGGQVKPTYQTLYEYGRKASLIPTGTGDYEVRLYVDDGFVKDDTSDMIHVKPKMENISLEYSFIDTSWYRTNGVYFHDNKFFVAIKPENIVRIYDLAGDSISFIKDINIPDVIRVYAIHDDLLYVGIPGPTGGYWGPGALSIYRLGQNWEVTPVLENYVPGTWDIFSMTFKESHTIVRDHYTLFNIDFYTNPASPQILAQRDYASKTIYNYHITGQYIYVGITRPERKIEILNKNSLTYVSDLPLPPDWGTINVDNQLLIVGYIDSLQLYSIVNPIEPIKLSTIQIPRPFNWPDEDYEYRYYGNILNDNLLAVKNYIGIEFFVVENTSEPEFKGCWYSGRYMSSTYHSGSYYIMGNDVMGSMNDKYFGLNKINLDFLSGIQNNTGDKTPKIFKLHQNYPNPFNPSTTIRYQLPVAGNVQLQIYNTLGQQVITLVDQDQEAGYHSCQWDITALGKSFASGLYFLQLRVQGQNGSQYKQSKKILLLK